MYKTTVTVEGMMCHMCEKHVNEAVSKAFAAENPVSDHTANKTAFISAEKPDAAKVDVDVKYIGFDIPNEFVVGYGLDYAEKYRNLRDVATLKPEVYS